MKASWGANEKVVNAPSDLEVVIGDVRKSGQPTMIFLEADHGRILIFGIGHDESVLTFFEPDGASFHSLGDPERSGHLQFLCRDQVDDFMAEMAVPERDALRAAAQFLDTGERPAAVTWEPDW